MVFPWQSISPLALKIPAPFEARDTLFEAFEVLVSQGLSRHLKAPLPKESKNPLTEEKLNEILAKEKV